MLSSKWRPVRHTEPCPICGRGDWCQISSDGRAVICRRVKSEKQTKSGGFFHRIDSIGAAPPAPAAVTPAAAPVPRIDWEKLQRQCRLDCPTRRLEFLAKQLGLSIESLDRLGTGWHARKQLWTFPMRDSQGRTIGIRTRTQTGRKFSIAGGNAGLFLPASLRTDRLLICEGPTDTAAMLDLGFSAIGRDSCLGGFDLIPRLLQQSAQRPQGGFAQVVIVSDRDEPKERVKGHPELGTWCPGQDGAEKLARKLRLFCPIVRLILPPEGVKDARDWLHAGGTAADVEAAIAGSSPAKLSISIKPSRERISK